MGSFDAPFVNAVLPGESSHLIPSNPVFIIPYNIIIPYPPPSMQPASEGGRTAFTNANLVVAGQAGDALFFRYKDDKGKSDPRGMTEHTGCPVIAGEKKIIRACTPRTLFQSEGFKS